MNLVNTICSKGHLFEVNNDENNSPAHLDKICPQCKRNRVRRERNQLMRDTGLVRVRGALSGTYWE